ncbi:hypothetical protein EMMF5_005448 [Cystobasidiomycetes sp. EMM_F5]
MDGYATRAPSTGPIRTGSVEAGSSKNKRLPPSSVVPSFFAASKPYDRAQDTSTSKHSGGSSSAGSSKASTSKLVDPARSSKVRKTLMARLSIQSETSIHSPIQLKQTVIDITKSLKSADNPITHSTSYGGFHRTSIKAHTLDRNYKLKAQAAACQSDIFKGVKCYINGVTTPLIGNLDLIRILQENGADVRYNFSKRSCTHIICTSNLSASKTHKELSNRSSTKVVSPQWVLDCVSEGKKLAETKYKVLSASETQHSVKEQFATALQPLKRSMSADPTCISGDANVSLNTSVDDPIVISSSQ